MSEHPLVRAYLRDLSAALDRERVPRYMRARILAEVADHLEEAVRQNSRARDDEARGADSVAAVRAVVRFGDAQAVARRFAAELAPPLAWSVTFWVATAFVSACALWATALAPSLRPIPWARDITLDPLRFVGVQLGFVVALLTSIRALRQRRHPEVVVERLRFVYRGNWLVALLTAGLLVPDLVRALMWPQVASASPVSLVLTLWLGVTVALVGAAIVRLASGLPIPSRSVGLSRYEADAEWALDDLIAAVGFVWTWLRRWAPWASPVVDRLLALGRATRARLVDQAPWLDPWLRPREHPHRVVVATAAAMGLLLAMAHGAVDGDSLASSASTGRFVMAVLADLLLVVVEFVGVVGAYALLGGFLGLRPQMTGRLAGSRRARRGSATGGFGVIYSSEHLDSRM